MEDSCGVHSVAVQYSQPVFLPTMHKPDRLTERINSLSHAWDYRFEKIPEGLIDSLPTEGLLAEYYYVTFGMMREPSLCRLSVMLVHATQRVELFGNIFAPSNSPGTWTLCIKILGKKIKGVLADHES